MRQLGIIADDLTGANDAGVQFAKYGLQTITVLDLEEKDLKLLSEAAVIVVDTETRNLNKLEAYERVRRLTESLVSQKISLIYKKIDSTLRGLPGVELMAVMRAIGVKVGVVVPAFPANKRIVSGLSLIHI